MHGIYPSPNLKNPLPRDSFSLLASQVVGYHFFTVDCYATLLRNQGESSEIKENVVDCSFLFLLCSASALEESMNKVSTLDNLWINQYHSFD